MRQINEDRQRRALLLSKHLMEIAVERDSLFVRLEYLERQAKPVQREFKTLHNLDAPISTLPNEMLAMIFQAGAQNLENRQGHFGTLVSHVVRQWHYIALETPQLWNDISFQHIRPGDPQIERAFSFLSRCRLSPINVSVVSFGRDEVLQDLRQLIGDHMGHCRRLRVTGVNTQALENIIQHISPNAAPLLHSINLTANNYGGELLEFLAPLFPSGAPRLRTAELGGFCVSTLHFCIPALQSIASLRLTAIIIENGDEAAYICFRNALMALPFLSHLELQPKTFGLIQPRLPIVLPTIQVLHLDATHDRSFLDAIINSFQAATLITLSLEGWRRHSVIEDGRELRFPSLEHLILLNTAFDHRDLNVFARRFPGIQWLTCQMVTGGWEGCDVEHILGAMCSNRGVWKPWPKIQVLAVSATAAHLMPVLLCSMISTLQRRGSRLRKLLLPKCLFAHEYEHGDAMAKLREMVEVEDYRLDWPRPFANHFEVTF